MEKVALTSHMKDKKQVDRSLSDQYIKSLMPQTPAPPLIIFKISCLETGVSNSKLPS